MIGWVVYFVVVALSVGLSGLVCFGAGAKYGRNQEKQAQRKRLEMRMRDAERTRPVARPGTSPARISAARINTHRMREE